MPEDRQKYGLVLSYPIADNLVLATYFEPPFAHGININEAAIRDKLSPVEVFRTLRPRYPQYAPAQLAVWVERFFRLFAARQWKREREQRGMVDSAETNILDEVPDTEGGEGGESAADARPP